MKNARLYNRLYRTYLLVTFASVTAIALFAAHAFRQWHVERVRQDLLSVAHLLQHRFDPHVLRNSSRVDSLCKWAGRVAEMRVTVILPSGQVLGDSHHDPRVMDNHADRPEVRQAVSGRVGFSVRHSFTLDTDLLYVAVPLENDGEVLGVLRLSLPTRTVWGALKPVWTHLAFAGIAVLLFIGVVTWLTTKRLTRPIERMAAAARRLAGGDLHIRVPTEGTVELQQLAQALNEMAADIQRRVETAEEQRRGLQAVMSNMEEGVIGLDAEGRIIAINAAARALLGAEVGSVEGKFLEEVRREPILCEAARRAMEEGKERKFEIELGDSAHRRILSVKARPMREPEREGTGCILVLEDVTHIRFLERVRRDFVANVAHELRTPVTSILGFVETLTEAPEIGEEKRRRFLQIVRRQAERLHQLVEDLLSLAALEDEEAVDRFPKRKLSVAKILEDAVEICSRTAEAKKTRVEIDCEPALTVVGNESLLVQAIVNLVDNAIKYSDPEKVVLVRAWRRDGSVAISVLDQGWGIEEKHLTRIFERFYRVDRARSREFGGTGLGLSIVKHVAEVHGGRITVRSEVGKGSEFVLTLPAD